MISHIIGAVFSILALICALLKSVPQQDPYAVLSSIICGGSMLVLYCISSIYHGLKINTGKKVLRILDHCAIYIMISGTYTPILLCALRPLCPAAAWALFCMEYALAALGVTLNAIDLKRFRVFSMVCYIFMGWAILFVLPQAIRVITLPGFLLLISGGIIYTIGAVLYAFGSRLRYLHCVFHFFVLAGSILQFLSILLYVL